MTDTFSKKQRSEIMKAVKSKGNKSTEIKLIEIFKSHHITGWRRNSNLVGHPDFIFPKNHVAIFADGCFWHGHNCRNVNPSDNVDYWRNKIKRNKARDKAITKELTEKGWKVIRIWECEIKKGKIRKLMTTSLFSGSEYGLLANRTSQAYNHHQDLYNYILLDESTGLSALQFPNWRFMRLLSLPAPHQSLTVGS